MAAGRVHGAWGQPTCLQSHWGCRQAIHRACFRVSWAACVDEVKAWHAIHTEVDLTCGDR